MGKKIYLENDLVLNWKSNPNTKMMFCPTLIDKDITNDSFNDFVCIIEMEIEGDMYPTIVVFKNYEMNKPLNPIPLSSVKDYGEKIGTGIYLTKDKKREGFAVYNFESSLAFIYFESNKFKEYYIAD
ncbi:MAG: hypothetical protein KA797_07465 [Chitinophagales bacterium]|nr:hypothetical protein [Chitinophagales bacterium]